MDKIGVQLETAGAFPLDRKMYFTTVEEFENYPSELKFDGMMIVIRQGAARGTYIYDKNTNSIAPCIQGVSKVLYISGEKNCQNEDVIDNNVVWGSKTIRNIELTDGTCFKGSFSIFQNSFNSQNTTTTVTYTIDLRINGNLLAQFVFSRMSDSNELGLRGNFEFRAYTKKISETDFSYFAFGNAFFQWQSLSVEERFLGCVSASEAGDYIADSSDALNFDTTLYIFTDPEIVIPPFTVSNFILEKVN